jgi:hypothetical protein
MYVLAWHSFDTNERFNKALKGAVVASFNNLDKAKERMCKDFKQQIVNYLEEADVTDPVEELHNLSATFKTDDGYILYYYIESVEES